jgi:predicted transcriptional regulator
MAQTRVNLHIGTLEAMGRRFAAARKAAEAGRAPARDHVTFLSLAAVMAAMSPRRLELVRHLRRAGPMSVRRLARDFARD